LDQLYKDLDDPAYDGDPVGILLLIKDLLGERDSKPEFGVYQILEDMEPDPGLFPDDPGFEVTTLTPPEILDAEALIPFDSSVYLQQMAVSEFNHSAPSISSDPMYRTRAPYLASWRMTRISL
jgi:hypothetical protein